MNRKNSTPRYQATISLVLLLFLIGLAARPAVSEPARPSLILYAFDEEGKLLASQMTITDRDTILGREVLHGKLADQEVLVAECGVGMTNAAMMTQRLIDAYQPRLVLLSGIAGAVDTSVQIGDIVIPSGWQQHDYGYWGAEGFKAHGIGVFLPAEQQVKRVETFAAYGTANLRVRSESLDLRPIGTRRPQVSLGGVGVSGNCFIDNQEKRLWLAERFGAKVVDMESAAVAQVCTVNDRPFVIIRSASDLAGGSGSSTAEAQMDQFMAAAAHNSAQVMVAVLRQFAK